MVPKMLTRNFVFILIGNVILGSAMPMLIILGGLAGAFLAPQEWFVTVPPSVQMLAGILVASPISLFMGRFGRRAGFLLGALTLGAGGFLAVVSLLYHSFVLLCVAHFLFGVALVCINYFRFAAAEAVVEKYRPQAISFTLASGLVAAIIGPELFSISKDAYGPIPFTGAYLAICGLALVGALPILPLKLSTPNSAGRKAKRANLFSVLKDSAEVRAAIAIGALSQAMMVLLMTPTPLAMIWCGFAETQAADVIRWHVIAMFAPGFFTGTVISRIGALQTATIGMFLMAVSAGMAALSLDLVNFYVALILLGVGWNFGFVSATHMLQAAVSDENKPVVQGANDTLLAISASSASLISGIAFVGIGWQWLVLVSAAVALVVFAGMSVMGLKRQLVGGRT
ncbi:MFS transporter [Ruegeria sp. ANG-S4]|nr:MFS transporter [Ruegeria sp. ANG-S4]